jgi:putative methyltransferase (TIGR04325 family)
MELDNWGAGMSNIEVTELKSVSNWEEALLLSKSYTDSALVSSLRAQFESELKSRFAGANRRMEAVRKCHLLLGFSFSCVGIARPRIADIGGGNGYMFDWIKSAHPSIDPNWIVFESKEIAQAYQDSSAGLEISFKQSSLFTNSSEFDLTIISCTLQYLDNWKDVLETALTASKYVLLMRIPLVDSEDHEVFVQTPGSGMYHDSNASWPMRMFSRKIIMSNFEEISEIVFSTYDPEETFPFNSNFFHLKLICSSRK